MKTPIVVNGRVYPVWQQLFLDRKEQWIGKKMKEYDRDVAQRAYGTIKDIRLEPNGDDSAMLHIDSNEGWGWACDVHYFGVSGSQSTDKYLALAGQFGSTIYLEKGA